MVNVLKVVFGGTEKLSLEGTMDLSRDRLIPEPGRVVG
jgi:hypothetical protein